MMKTLLALVMAAVLALPVAAQTDAGQPPAEKAAAPAVAPAQTQAAAPVQTTAPAQSPTETAPAPAPEMERLSKLMMGRWTTEETIAPGPFAPNGGTGKGMNIVRPGPGGLSLLMEYRSQSVSGTFSGHGVISWDPAKKVYNNFWVDNMAPGGTMQTGTWVGNALIFSSADELDGQKVAMQQVYGDFKDDSFTFNIKMGPEDSLLKNVMTVKYTRNEGIGHGSGPRRTPRPATKPERP